MSMAAAIGGIAELPMGKYPDCGSLHLHARAAEQAIADAGLTKQDVDGVLTAGSRTEAYLVHALALAELLGIETSLAATIDLGGAAHASLVGYAAMAIAAGSARNVLVVSADNTLSAFSAGGVAELLAEVGPPHAAYERPHGPTVPSLYALVAQRYMHEYGLTPEHLAMVCASQRAHALRHPGAFMKKPLSRDDAMAARMIATPLRLFDCAPVCDGAGAVLVTSREQARDLGHPVVEVRGVGEGNGFHHLGSAPSLTSFGAAGSSERALRQAGVEIGDIDVAQIYDCFSVTLLVTLADMGFCAHGEAGDYVAEGKTGPGARCPVNTHGGLLSHGHPGRAGGLFHLIEAVAQLRGQAGERQVRDAELALVHGIGGVLSNHTSLVLGKG